jgi:MoaA/NifB/PqqE/SkfB family radical SAM enzyme
VKTIEVLRAWRQILQGRKPSLSIEITRECPLRCPGCYAYGSDHIGPGMDLRQLSDYRADELVAQVLALVKRHKPLHLSIVGGDPLVRFRELELLLPQLDSTGIHVQVVTSAFRPIPLSWNRLSRLNLVVSIDGLQPEHDVRRKPATYERILKNIAGHNISVHCTITSQMFDRPDYLEEFISFWSSQAEAKRIWFSIYTPQVGESAAEILSIDQRALVVEKLLSLRTRFPKLDMKPAMIREFLSPPSSPEQCIFAQTTKIISADMKSEVTPCQFGGTPDCSQCGCVASMGLAAIGHQKVLFGLTAGRLFHISNAVGRAQTKRKRAISGAPTATPIPATQASAD